MAKTVLGTPYGEISPSGCSPRRSSGQRRPAVARRSPEARKQNIEASPHDAFRQMPYGKDRERPAEWQKHKDTEKANNRLQDFLLFGTTIKFVHVNTFTNSNKLFLYKR